MTVDEAKALLGISRVRVCELARKGTLEGMKRAGCWFFQPSTVRKFIEKRAVKRGEAKA